VERHSISRTSFRQYDGGERASTSAGSNRRFSHPRMGPWAQTRSTPDRQPVWLWSCHPSIYLLVGFGQCPYRQPPCSCPSCWECPFPRPAARHQRPRCRLQPPLPASAPAAGLCPRCRPVPPLPAAASAPGGLPRRLSPPQPLAPPPPAVGGGDDPGARAAGRRAARPSRVEGGGCCGGRSAPVWCGWGGWWWWLAVRVAGGGGGRRRWSM